MLRTTAPRREQNPTPGDHLFLNRSRREWCRTHRVVFTGVLVQGVSNGVQTAQYPRGGIVLFFSYISYRVNRDILLQNLCVIVWTTWWVNSSTPRLTRYRSCYRIQNSNLLSRMKSIMLFSRIRKVVRYLLTDVFVINCYNQRDFSFHLFRWILYQQVVILGRHSEQESS